MRRTASRVGGPALIRSLECLPHPEPHQHEAQHRRAVRAGRKRGCGPPAAVFLACPRLKSPVSSRRTRDMPEDERAIRTLIANWLAASRSGDLPRVLSLMAEDVLFLVPGKAPFGKAEFAASSAAMKDVRIDT